MAVKNLRNSESYVARRHPAFARPHHQTQNPSTSGKVERHRKRKIKDKEEIPLELDDTQNVATTGGTGQKERKKSKIKKSSPPEGAGVIGGGKTEIISRADEESLKFSRSEEEPPVDKKRTKKRKLEEVQEKAGSSTEDKPKKCKKSKKVETPTEATALDDIPKTSSKKRKNSTGFSDPRKDTELSDQAQKVLSYAFTQFYKPKKWKFNKARQNWLIRNLWSNDEVPDTYFPLVVAYLAKVQGGTRENLLKSCNQALDTSLPTETATEPTALFSDTAPTPTNNSEATQAKLARAKAILECMKSSEGLAS